jgi:hypothetical protein
MKKVFAAALLLGSAPAFGDDDIKPISVAHGWVMFRANSTCSLAAEYQTGGKLIVRYDYRLDDAFVVFTDPSVKSLKAGDKKIISMVFVKGSSTLDTAWGATNFAVGFLDGKTMFSSNFDGDDFLTDLSRYELIGFKYGDVVLQSFELANSRAAVTSLRQCAREQSLAHPSDPFGN